MSTNDAKERPRNSETELDDAEEVNPGDPGPEIPRPRKPTDPRCDDKLPPHVKPPPAV